MTRTIKTALVLALCLAGVASAQTVTVTASPTSGNVSVAPTVTWSTTLANASCVASGDWSGNKPASGTQTLPALTKTATFKLDCTSAAVAAKPGTALVSWSPVTSNTDGSAITDLAGYKVFYGTDPAGLTLSASVTDPKATSWGSPSLNYGTWYFAAAAVNAAGTQSSLSNMASKLVGTAPIAAQTASGSATVTVIPAPMPPVITVSVVAAMPTVSPIYRAVTPNQIGTTLFGFMPTGTPCGAYVGKYRGLSWYRVKPTPAQLWYTKDASNLVAPCG